jgi:hypothetical protein
MTAVKVVRSSGRIATTSDQWVTLPGATTTISVQNSTKALVIARFAANDVCVDEDQFGTRNCHVRILVGGVEADPAGDSANVFDTDDGPLGDLEAHAIERSRGPLGPGSYIVTVQWKTSAPSVTLAMQGWHLTVERIKV